MLQEVRTNIIETNGKAEVSKEEIKAKFYNWQTQ